MSDWDAFHFVWFLSVGAQWSRLRRVAPEAESVGNIWGTGFSQ